MFRSKSAAKLFRILQLLKDYTLDEVVELCARHRRKQKDKEFMKRWREEEEAKKAKSKKPKTKGGSKKCPKESKPEPRPPARRGSTSRWSRGS